MVAKTKLKSKHKTTTKSKDVASRHHPPLKGRIPDDPYRVQIQKSKKHKIIQPGWVEGGLGRRARVQKNKINPIGGKTLESIIQEETKTKSRRTKETKVQEASSLFQGLLQNVAKT
ncbi:hypothetical protein ATANTOWER_010666 [Ataeniobius toweri]|uniref:Uncharacterized protein n=1 Tax=Ataeniobius toweri TaxID=208326 RepID=A0ABU7C9X2_9TELE|nr:hypothetical protein [Ataeniobius toweri]